MKERRLGLSTFGGVVTPHYLDFDSLKKLSENDPDMFWRLRNSITRQVVSDECLRSEENLELQNTIDAICQKASDPVVNLNALTVCLVEKLESLRAVLGFYLEIAQAGDKEMSPFSRVADLANQCEKQLCELERMASAITPLQKKLQSNSFMGGSGGVEGSPKASFLAE